MFYAINTSGSGLTAAKKWMEVASNNIANVNTTNGPDAAPYSRRAVVLEQRNSFKTMLGNESGGGVQIASIATEAAEKLVYDPAHPHANQEGYVRYPNIDVTAEMTNTMVAQKMYQANTTVLNANKKMLDVSLEIGRV